MKKSPGLRDVHFGSPWGLSFHIIFQKLMIFLLFQFIISIDHFLKGVISKRQN